MALRDVTLQYDVNENVGDETYELWMKIGSGAWALAQVGDVEQVADTQEFQLLSLTEGVAHLVQVRQVRSGRYREDYLGTDPALWPAQSLASFTPGETDIAAPTINSAVWSRTSGSSQRVTVDASPASGHSGTIIQLLRNGVVVDEATSPSDLVDLDPPIATTPAYTVRHRSGFLIGDASAATNVYTGPVAPTGLNDQTITTFYSYAIGWNSPPSGAITRVQDDYMCEGNFAERGVTIADADTFSTNDLEKNSAMAPNGNTDISVAVRIRHEVESFGVTDVGNWSAPIAVATQIAPDETAFHSCT